jgi:hypothetical protein
VKAIFVGHGFTSSPATPKVLWEVKKRLTDSRPGGGSEKQLFRDGSIAKIEDQPLGKSPGNDPHAVTGGGVHVRAKNGTQLFDFIV